MTGCSRRGAFLAAGWTGLVGFALALAADRSEAPPPYHRDPGQVEEAVLEATRGYLREDLEAAGAAMRRLAELSRPLQVEDEKLLGREIVAYEAAYRLTLNEARQFARAGNQESSFNRFVWVLRGCSTCHARLREDSEATDSAEKGGGAEAPNGNGAGS